MLQRVQDQNKLTIDAYRTVFEGSVDHVTNVGWESDNAIRNLRSYVSSASFSCVELVCLLLCLIRSSIAKSFEQAQAQVFLSHLLFAMLFDQSFASVCLSQCLFILSSAQSGSQSIIPQVFTCTLAADINSRR